MPKTASKPAVEPKKADKGLGKPQERILKALVRKDGQTRKEIAESAEVDTAWLTSWIGSNNPDIRKPTSLLSLGLLKAEEQDGRNGEGGKSVTIYKLTAAGRKAASKISD